jgi:hypothetical protein
MEFERFVDRHPSVLRALLAHGVPEAEARRLADQAKAGGRTTVCITSEGRRLMILRMRGNHADVYVTGPGGE